MSAVFGYLAVRDARPHETWEAFREARAWWLAPALVVLTAAFALRAVRWWSLFEGPRRPSLAAVCRATFVGYVANNVLPARAGEAARAVSLSRRAGRPVVEVVATMVIERTYDVLSLILLLFLMVPALPDVAWLRSAGIGGAVLLAALLVAAALVLRFGERPLHLLLRPLRRVPLVPAAFLDRAPREFVAGLAGLRRPRVALVAFAWTTASWLVLGVGFWLVMLAFDLGLSPLAGLLVVIGIGLAMILPSSPAALGVFEAATVVVLAAYGVDRSRALSYALVLHAVNLLPFLVVGLGWVAVRRLRAAPVTPPGPRPPSRA